MDLVDITVLLSCIFVHHINPIIYLFNDNIHIIIHVHVYAYALPVVLPANILLLYLSSFFNVKGSILLHIF